jgi:hypothetical protein
MFSSNEIAAIYAIDLNQIKTKLMHVPSGEGWTAEHADAVELEYRRFLHLAKMYPEGGFAPSEAVDTFWHYHILDTVKYAADCEQLFGYFLHHHPYLGMGDEESEQEHIETAERSQAMYQATFGVADQAASNDTAFCAMRPGDKEAMLAVRPTDKVVESKAAFCAMRPPNKAVETAAFCAMRPPNKAVEQAAFCAMRPPNKAVEKAAFCAMRPPNKAVEKAAFCAMRPPNKAVEKAAFCAMRPPNKAVEKAAFCAMRPPNKAVEKAAFCAMRPTDKTRAMAAFCAMRPTDKILADDAAFCAVLPNENVLARQNKQAA